MRRTTSNTLLEEARLLMHLLQRASDRAIVHHAAEFRSFLVFLHERAEITHSVSDLLPVRSFPHPDALLAGEPCERWEARIVGSRKLLFRLLGEITERRVKLRMAASMTPADIRITANETSP